MEEKLKKDGSLSLSQLLKRLKSAAEAKGWSLEQRTARMKEREKKVVAKCFHGAGIVVPIDKNGVGYRPLPETPGVFASVLVSWYSRCVCTCVGFLRLQVCLHVCWAS